MNLVCFCCCVFAPSFGCSFVHPWFEWCCHCCRWCSWCFCSDWLPCCCQFLLIVLIVVANSCWHWLFGCLLACGLLLLLSLWWFSSLFLLCCCWLVVLLGLEDRIVGIVSLAPYPARGAWNSELRNEKPAEIRSRSQHYGGSHAPVHVVCWPMWSPVHWVLAQQLGVYVVQPKTIPEWFANTPTHVMFTWRVSGSERFLHEFNPGCWPWHALATKGAKPETNKDTVASRPIPSTPHANALNASFSTACLNPASDCDVIQSLVARWICFHHQSIAKTIISQEKNTHTEVGNLSQTMIQLAYVCVI